MARTKLRPPTRRRRAGRRGRPVNMGWWTTVTAVAVLGVLGVVLSRSEISEADIVRTVAAPKIDGAAKVTVVKVLKEAFDRVEEGDAIFEVKAKDKTRKVEAPVDGVVASLAATQGQEVAAGAELAKVQTGPDFAAADHWHTAYGVNVCGTWLPPVGQFESDLHTHADGLVHAHPRSTSAAGRNATLRLFFDRAGLELTATKLEYSDGQTYESGEVECADAPGGDGDKKKAVLRWAVNGKEQKGNPANFVVGNGDVVAIAFVGEGDELPTLPPSTTQMADYAIPKHPGYVPPETTTSLPAGGAPAGEAPPSLTPTSASGG